MELYYGGCVAPNIYYLGAANVVNFGGLRIAGLSGIWKGYDYNKPHHERLPYGQDDVKSVYHVREWDARKLLQIKTQVDVGISHDWPNGVEWMGDWKKLFKKKDSFEADARNGTLGSKAARFVLDRLRPAWWFSAHMHCKFAAVVKFDGEGKEANAQIDNAKSSSNPNEISLGTDEDEAAMKTAAPVKNEAEIDLDMDDDEDTSSPAVFRNGIPGAVPSSDTVPQDIRAQLPASFTKPQGPYSGHIYTLFWTWYRAARDVLRLSYSKAPVVQSNACPRVEILTSSSISPTQTSNASSSISHYEQDHEFSGA